MTTSGSLFGVVAHSLLIAGDDRYSCVGRERRDHDEIKRAGIDTIPVVPIVFALDNYGPVAAEYPVPFENGTKGIGITVRCMNEQFAMLATSLLLGAGGDGITAELLTNA